MRRGVTLPELAMVLAIVGVLSALAFPRAASWLDRIAVSRAAGEVAAFYQTARFAAIFRSQRVRLELGQDSLRAVFEGPRDSVFLKWPGPARHRVDLTVTRATIVIQSNGLGFGAANTKVVLRKGMAAESLTTSRLGRLKRWR
ncbi:MAG: prepilin-type N-terminal cleavage/methylation domain-containing protein [Gemmatimonadetes bacterium]|nr:prepilin-type N-terminal cleavage/methylation domain-containing protein [Gemmatimonadota bacterium]